MAESAAGNIRILTEPAVYLVGKQMIEDSELDRFLADHGVSWESDSEIAAEVLTETAGRVCYMWFAKPRPGGNSAYLTTSRKSATAPFSNTRCGTSSSRACRAA